MHRVELKDCSSPSSGKCYRVPNAPCGVESSPNWIGAIATGSGVPNAPCGVESGRTLSKGEKTGQFLMHRVELKALLSGQQPPTVPAGFLMHRVELKVICVGSLHKSALC